MATQTQVTIVDDINGSTEDVITCAFGLGDSQYEIDLGPDNREELEQFLERFIQAARPVRSDKSGRASRAKSARKVIDRDRTAEIRSWAKDAGLDVSERGRISKAVVEAYESAH